MDVYKDDLALLILRILARHSRGLTKNELVEKVRQVSKVRRNKVFDYLELLEKEGFIECIKKKGRGSPHIVKLKLPEPYKFFERLRKLEDKVDRERVKEWRKNFDYFIEQCNTLDQFILDLVGFVTLVLDYTAFDVERREKGEETVGEGEIALDLFLFELVPQLGNIFEECIEKLLHAYAGFVERLKERTGQIKKGNGE